MSLVVQGAAPPRLRRKRRGRPAWWHGWAISIFLCAFIVIFTKPPPSEDMPPPAETTPTIQEQASRVSKENDPGKASKKDIEDSGGLSSPVHKGEDIEGGEEYDALVQCELTTPFATDKSSADGTLDITVHRTLAPQASRAFLGMVGSNHFDGNFIFRAVEGFIVQFGIESPKKGPDGKASTKHFAKADIDPPPTDGDKRRSNVRGTLNFAGGNSAMGQVYINRSDNLHLDKEKGSLPFASLNYEGMKVIDAVHSYKEGQGQVKAVKEGDWEVRSKFPLMSRIERCWIESQRVPVFKKAT